MPARTLIIASQAHLESARVSSPHSLSERFCQRHQLPTQRFEAEVFRLALYPHARLVHFMVSLFARDFFAVDRELVRAAGALSSTRQFRLEELSFHDHPHNSRFLRRSLLLRVSTRRLQALLSAPGDTAKRVAVPA